MQVQNQEKEVLKCPLCILKQVQFRSKFYCLVVVFNFTYCMVNFRKLLFPFAIVYGVVTYIRNKLFDYGILKTYVIPIKSITVGNLSVGGTGKTPHVSFLVSFLADVHKIAILSRGYGRKTKGYIQVSGESTASTVGDEPLQYFMHYSPKVSVIVSESRAYGAKKIIQDIKPDVLILDDALQHRKVKIGRAHV